MYLNVYEKCFTFVCVSNRKIFQINNTVYFPLGSLLKVFQGDENVFSRNIEPATGESSFYFAGVLDKGRSVMRENPSQMLIMNMWPAAVLATSSTVSRNAMLTKQNKS